MEEIKNGEQILAEKAARGPLPKPSTPAGPLLPLDDDADLEIQLKAARAVVCVPGQHNPVCMVLMQMSLLLAEDIGAETEIRERYAKLIEAQGTA